MFSVEGKKVCQQFRQYQQTCLRGSQYHRIHYGEDATAETNPKMRCVAIPYPVMFRHEMPQAGERLQNYWLRQHPEFFLLFQLLHKSQGNLASG